jgi:hypothetical protein
MSQVSTGHLTVLNAHVQTCKITVGNSRRKPQRPEKKKQKQLRLGIYTVIVQNILMNSGDVSFFIFYKNVEVSPISSITEASVRKVRNSVLWTLPLYANGGMITTHKENVSSRL